MYYGRLIVYVGKKKLVNHLLIKKSQKTSNKTSPLYVVYTVRKVCDSEAALVAFCIFSPSDCHLASPLVR